jgi:hypothetical protein
VNLEAAVSEADGYEDEERRILIDAGFVHGRERVWANATQGAVAVVYQFRSEGGARMYADTEEVRSRFGGLEIADVDIPNAFCVTEEWEADGENWTVRMVVVPAGDLVWMITAGGAEPAPTVAETVAVAWQILGNESA